MKSEIAELITRLFDLTGQEGNDGSPWDELYEAAQALEEAYKPVDDAEVAAVVYYLRQDDCQIFADRIERLARERDAFRNHSAENSLLRDVSDIQRDELITQQQAEIERLHKQCSMNTITQCQVEKENADLVEQRDQLQEAIDQECKWNWFEDGIYIPDTICSLEKAYKQGREDVIKNLKPFATKPEDE